MSMFNGVMMATAPPNGTTPDPDAPYEAADLIAVSSVFYGLAVITTIIRIYTRAAMVRNVSFDDYVMTAAMVLSTVLLGSVMNMLNWGLGKHMWNVRMQPDLYPNFMLDNIIAAIVFCLATGLAKGSILLFYLRIFPAKSMRWTVWILFTFTVGYSVASALVNVFSCDPIAASWMLEYVPTAKCINRPVFYFAQASLGIFTDITTVVAPLPLLRTLQLPTKQKIGVGALLTIGAFVCVVSAIRLKSLYVLLTDTDLTWNTKDALMWVILELNLSILGGNIPALKPFVKRFFPKLLGTTGRTGAASNGVYLHSGSGRDGPSAKAASFGGSRATRTGGDTKYGVGVSASRVVDKSSPVSHNDDDGTGSEEFIMHSMPPPQQQNSAITKTVVFGFEEQERQYGDFPRSEKESRR